MLLSEIVVLSCLMIGLMKLNQYRQVLSDYKLKSVTISSDTEWKDHTNFLFGYKKTNTGTESVWLLVA